MMNQPSSLFDISDDFFSFETDLSLPSILEPSSFTVEPIIGSGNAPKVGQSEPVIQKQAKATRKRKRSSYTPKYTKQQRLNKEREDEEKLQWYDSQVSLTEEQKILRKKCYNRITARRSRKKSRQSKKTIENSLREMSDRIEELEKKLAASNAQVQQLHHEKMEILQVYQHTQRENENLRQRLADVDSQMSDFSGNDSPLQFLSSKSTTCALGIGLIMLLVFVFMYGSSGNMLMSQPTASPEVPHHPSREISFDSYPEAFLPSSKTTCFANEKDTLIQQHTCNMNQTLHQLLNQKRTSISRGPLPAMYKSDYAEFNQLQVNDHCTMYRTNGKTFEEFGDVEDLNVFLVMGDILQLKQGNGSKNLLLVPTDEWSDEVGVTLSANILNSESVGKTFLSVNPSGAIKFRGSNEMPEIAFSSV